jgi:hypothetical protein
MRTIRTATACAAVGLLLAATPAPAAEVPWTYTTTISAGNSGLIMDLGHLDLPDATTGVILRHYYYAQLSHPNPTGGFDGPATWRVVGFGLGDVSDSLVPRHGLDATNDMQITVSIRDAASGQEGGITTYSFVGISFDNNTGSLYPYIGANLDPHPLVLGDNRYIVGFNYDQNGQEAWFTASVKVQPASQTPEPGTLALAGIGMGAFGLAARRRSRAARAV